MSLDTRIRSALLMFALVVPVGVAAQAVDDPKSASEQDSTLESAPRPSAPVLAPATAHAERGGASAVATIVLDTPRRDRGPGGSPVPDNLDTPRLLHGFRLGYVFVANYDEPTERDDRGSSLRQRDGLKSPHQFLLGYEVMSRITGSGWLNVLLIANVSITGLEQSRLFPSANLLMGFEVKRAFQLGVGINLMPVDSKAAHMILAAGWTPRTGDVYLPFHVFLIPDIDTNHRLGTTIGVNWEI